MKLADIAARIGGTLEGDGSVEIEGLSSLAEAAPGQITFLANPKYASEVSATAAAAVLVNEDWTGECPCARIRVKSADRAFAEVATLLSPPPVTFEPGIHPTAVIADDATVGKNVTVGPHCVIEPGAVIGDNCVLVAGCYVGHDAELGQGCMLRAHVTVRERSRLGERVTIHDGSVIGSDGFGYTPDANGVWQKVMQLGSVDIGDDVEIGANVTIDRARFGKTVIGNGVKIDNLVQVAHNVRVGDHAVMAAQVGISGSTRIGRHAQLGGQAGLAGHLQVGEGAVVGAQAGVTKDVPPKTFVSGYPAMDHRKATKMHAHLMRLPELKKRVRELEAAINALKKGSDE
jgi:UDP-3-O-[3-hydroxymyristoyl] glucosamine N-acyltransferase